MTATICSATNLSTQRQPWRSTFGASILLLILVLSNGPLFVCMPVINDVAMYDVQAMNVMQGGVAYRDIMEPNAPGVLWAHIIIRSLFGTGSEAIRIFDLFLFSTTAVLLARGCAFANQTASREMWVIAFLFLFYFSISEWNHCQRDIWMLFSAACCLWLRCFQIVRLQSLHCSSLHASLFAVIEGMTWGVGVWIKPMLLIPAFVCWVVSVTMIRSRRGSIVDATGLLFGGVAAGAAGYTWLQLTGAWPFFLDTILHWNPQYFAAGRQHWTLARFLTMCVRLFPWLLLHVPATVLASRLIFQQMGKHACQNRGAGRTTPTFQILLSALYFGWLIQSFLLQHLFDYVHVPGVVLAIAVIAVAIPSFTQVGWQRVAWWVFVVLAVVTSPVIRLPRLACLPTCLASGSTPWVRDRCKLLRYPNWEDLENVSYFLKSKEVSDRELLCFSDNTIHLYTELAVLPSIRMTYVEQFLVFFPARKNEFTDAVLAANPRYIVADLKSAGVGDFNLPTSGSKDVRRAEALIPRAVKASFPWNMKIVFASGQYVVFEHQEKK